MLISTGLLASFQKRCVLRKSVTLDIASHREFLLECSAQDLQRPYRVVADCDTGQASEMMRGFYRPVPYDTLILFASGETSALIEFPPTPFRPPKDGRHLRESGGDVLDVAFGIGLDGRIVTIAVLGRTSNPTPATYAMLPPSFGRVNAFRALGCAQVKSAPDTVGRAHRAPRPDERHQLPRPSGGAG